MKYCNIYAHHKIGVAKCSVHTISKCAQVIMPNVVLRWMGLSTVPSSHLQYNMPAISAAIIVLFLQKAVL